MSGREVVGFSIAASAAALALWVWWAARRHRIRKDVAGGMVPIMASICANSLSGVVPGPAWVGQGMIVLATILLLVAIVRLWQMFRARGPAPRWPPPSDGPDG